MAQNIEKRGIGLNEIRHMKQLITLRNGELKFFDTDALKLINRVFLHQKFECSISDKRLEMIAAFPIPGKYAYKFSSEKELYSWYDAMKESIKIEGRKQRRRIDFLKAGIWVYLSGEENSKQFVWIEGGEIRWAKQKLSSGYKRIQLSEITGIFYGFSRRTMLISSPHAYLASKPAVVIGTLKGDIRMCTIREQDLKDFLLGIQWLVVAMNPKMKLNMFSEGQFYYKKFQLKLDEKARAAGLTYYTYLKAAIKAAIASKKDPFHAKTERLACGFPRSFALNTTREGQAERALPSSFTEYFPPKIPAEKRTISLHLISDNMFDSNKENTCANAPVGVDTLLDVSVTNIEQSSIAEPSNFITENNTLIMKPQKTMGEQSFSLDANWEVSRIGPEKTYSEEIEGQHTSRFRQTGDSKGKPVEIVEENGDSLTITQLKRKIQELQEENMDNQRQAKYWKTKLSLVSQDLGDKLAEKNGEINALRDSKNELEVALINAKEENATLFSELAQAFGLKQVKIGKQGRQC
eukprot:TRINITY_DN136115_c1_g1_i1.p1 TRINITY_DN136115_c1_g1~~TRINITY_DN136115_c1_g1_i1.p1  ORF type:complete len:554 (+),score=56.23 TRINITY_DN136115_c1_g1_i1:98-1663(+)